MWLGLTAAVLAASAVLALAASIARPSPTRNVVSFAASSAAVVVLLAASAQRAQALAQAFAGASFGLTSLALAIGVWRCSRGGGGNDSGDDGGGGGGSGRWPPPRPPDPQPEPDWWPAFEREFRAYAAAHAPSRKLQRGSRLGRAPASGQAPPDELSS